MALDLHLKTIEASIQELLELSPTLAAPKASIQLQYIGTCVDNTATLLCSIANSIDGGARNIVFSDENNWHSAMQAIHRSFYSSILSFVEKGCADLCASKGIKPTTKRISSVISIIQLIEQNSNISPEAREQIKAKIESLVGKTPAFMDYINAVVGESKLTAKRAAMWRKYFRALSIVRNKSSHSDVDLSSAEINDLKSGGLTALVSTKNELQLNTSNYKQVCEHIILFFEEVTA